MEIKKTTWNNQDRIDVNSTKPTSIILLHGRGGNAEDIINLSRHFFSKNNHYVAITAPSNQWYPKPFTLAKSQNQPQLQHSLDLITSLIKELRHASKNKISIVGFSQGACLALELSQINPQYISTTVALSGGLIGENDEIIQENKPNNTISKPNIYISGSQNDPFIPLERMTLSQKQLEKNNYNVTLNTYPGNTHTVTQTEINLLQELFLQE